MKKPLSLCFALLSCCIPAFAQINIVAAENMYGDIAKTLGGQDVNVTSIINNPNQDPHLFSSSVETKKLIETADIVVINGADYDTWANKLTRNIKGKVINVAKINHVKSGANPHLWYNLDYVNQYAKTLTADLIKAQPADEAVFKKNLKDFLENTADLNAQIQQFKKQHKDKAIAITATEPIAGYLAEALGLTVLDEHFQLSVMNDTEPSAKDRAQILDDLNNHRVALLIYNQQVTDPTTDIIRKAAQKANVPIVSATELLPVFASKPTDSKTEIDKTTDYITWYQATLNRINDVLTPKPKI